MTIKEFSDKYQIPYNIAFKASYVVHPVETFRRDKEYNEQELYNESVKYAKSRLKMLTYQRDQYVTALKNLGEL